MGVVWEGEWPWLKQSVRAVRETTQSSVLAARELVTERSIEAATTAMATADETIHQQSVAFSRFCFQNPWVGQAALITAATSFVGAKSIRWSPVAVVRNSALTMCIATVAAFPDDVREAAGRVFPLQ